MVKSQKPKGRKQTQTSQSLYLICSHVTFSLQNIPQKIKELPTETAHKNPGPYLLRHSTESPLYGLENRPQSAESPQCPQTWHEHPTLPLAPHDPYVPGYYPPASEPTPACDPG